MASSMLSFCVPKPIGPTYLSCCLASTTAAPVTSADQDLDQKFGRKGIKFNDSTGEVELTVRNGSSLKLHIPTAHVTSYMPKVYWKDDGFEELLYTLPPSSSSLCSRGGIGLAINHVGSNKNVAFESWTVKDTDSDSIDALQVELSCSSSGSLEITYVVSLFPLSMASAVIIKNNGKKPVELNSAILTHFLAKKRSGIAINGLRSCSYCSFPPLSSPYQILSPSEAVKAEDPDGFFNFGWEPEMKTGEWGIQNVPYTVLKHKLSRVYSAPPSERSKEFYNTLPSNYDILDQGRELFFRVIRMGYEDIYLGSPGSLSRQYGKDYFICTGPASLLVPLVISPGEDWKGAQVIEHDNL